MSRNDGTLAYQELTPDDILSSVESLGQIGRAHV